ncbi:MAG: cupin domain-containing protein [Gammaproteobacteria bacterium]|nr:cupin domain-containing protein [Gammaproteobacteria bacterium]
MAEKQKFVHEEGDKAVFVERGLRSYFEYRDLAIKDGTHGDYVAHVIRAKEGHNATGQWHWHDCTFQMYYVLKGWARFEYEGQGIHTVRAGDCVLQPAKIRHREIEHSADLELIEIVAPANFATHECEAPESSSDAAD